MALETAPWRRTLNADRLGWVLIGECTSDNGVHVHRNAISMCAPALPYMAACLTVAARPPERRRRSGAFGRRRERPPLWGCLDRHRGGLACAHPCHPPPGGRSPPAIPSGKAIKRRCERGVSTNPAAGRVRAMACRSAGVQGIEGGGATLASPCRGPAKRGPKG